MTLEQLAQAYRESARLCAEYRRNLIEQQRTQPMSRTDRLQLRRRIAVFGTMARETAATAQYLEHYYDRRDRIERD